MTISCDIGLAPKQTTSQYKLTSLYGQCNIPSRSSSRKRRSEPDEEDFSKINISKTFNISSKSNKKSNAFRNHSFSVALIIIGMFLLWCLLGTQLQNEELLYSSWLILNDWFFRIYNPIFIIKYSETSIWLSHNQIWNKTSF